MRGVEQPDRDAQIRLASAIANGAAIDWESVSSSAQDDSERNVFTQLQEVARIAAAHRESSSRSEGVWGPLVIRARIGRGAYGEVFHAYDPQLERDVALKLLAPKLLDESRLVREARLTAKVVHPHVVQVHGAATHGGRFGLWMELIEGWTLEAELAARGPLSAREAASIGIELCGALAAIHAAGLVHGDVKTQNVMRAYGGRTVLMDFSASWLRTSAGDSGRVSGTPGYLAPEILRGAESSGSADIYALGVLLFRLTTGDYPVVGDSIDALRTAHATGQARRLADLRPDLPTAFVRVVESALDADPVKRVASAAAFESALAQAIGLVTHTRSGEPAPTATPGATRSSRGIGLTAAIGALVVSAMILGWVSGLFQKGDGIEDRSIKVHLIASGVADRAIGPGDVVNVGQRLQLEIEAATPLWIYLLNADDRSLTVLFPLPTGSLSNPIAKGLVRLPGQIGGVDQAWQVTRRSTSERFVVVASRERLPALEEILSELPSARADVTPDTSLGPELRARVRGVLGLAPAATADVGDVEGLFANAAPFGTGSLNQLGVWVGSIELRQRE